MGCNSTDKLADTLIFAPPNNRLLGEMLKLLSCLFGRAVKPLLKASFDKKLFFLFLRKVDIKFYLLFKAFILLWPH